MGHALYRKYRPLKLSDVVGQDHITSTLSNAIRKGKIAHAYLLTGPRGVGKTSVARILAHEINELKYTSQDNHIDIIEIDAASNRGIEEIRDLREKVYIAPTSSKYKIYIIDEVHMLTTYAFNALLKTLEEPPEHVVFILATTDAHKLPDTIISRTQRYNFNSVGSQNLIDQLRMISKTENINISDEALELIAEHGMGSFRDAISMLDQLTGQDTAINTESIYKLLGVPSNKLANNLIDTVDNCANLGEIILILQDMYQKGYQSSGISDAIVANLRQQIIDNNDNISSKLALMNELLDVPSAFNPTRCLEITLLKYARLKSATGNKIVTKDIQKTNSTKNSPEKHSEELPQNNQKNDNLVAKTPATKNAKTAPVQADTIVFDSKLSEDLFSALLQSLKTQYNTLYGIVRMADHEFLDNELILTFKFALHQKRVNEPSNQKVISDLLKKLTGKKTKLTCLLNRTANNIPESEQASNDNSDKIKTLSNIFGDAELLES